MVSSIPLLGTLAFLGPHRPNFARPNFALPRHPVVRAGVPGFLTWVDNAVPTAVTPISENYTASVVAFDMNAILHAQLRKAHDEQHAVTLVFARLHATLRHIRPGSTVLLALDGPAPAA